MARPSAAAPYRSTFPSSLSLFKFKLGLSPSSLLLHHTFMCLATRAAPFTIGAASVPPLPSVEHTSPVKGSSLSPFLSLELHPALAELFLPQVHVLGALRSCTSITSVRRPELAAVANLRHRSFFVAGKLVFFVLEW
jgi:hypothetical protein